MEQQLKQRLLGTIVLIAIAVIVLPLLLDGEGYKVMQRIEIDTPKKPPFGYRQEGFTTPLKELNNRNDLLDPPQAIDIKEFNSSATESILLEQQRATEEEGAAPEIASDAPEPELTTTWVMQVGSFSIEGNALAARKKLETVKLKNTIVEIDNETVDRQEIYVVKIVSEDYEALGKFAKLIEQDYPDAFIKERE